MKDSLPSRQVGTDAKIKSAPSAGLYLTLHPRGFILGATSLLGTSPNRLAKSSSFGGRRALLFVQRYDMSGVRILLANEPRSYRETLAAAFRILKPNTEVFVTDPDKVDGEVERLNPQLVICSRTTSTVETESLAWVELYPEYSSVSVVSIGGERSTNAWIELGDLLSVIDRTETLAREK